MKKLLVALFILQISVAAFGQYDTTAPYLKSKTLPNFNLLNMDSVVFTQQVLQADKKTIIILFNPECSHCKHEVKRIISLPPEIMNTTNILLTSTEALKKIKFFADSFGLKKYPNIFIGQDYKYFFGGFFQPKTIPVLAFYNAQKQFTFFNQGSLKKEEIIDALKK